jgi:hypothetical protein
MISSMKTAKNYGGRIADEITVDKSKFDALLGKMLKSPPLPKDQVKVDSPKPNKSKGVKRGARKP